MNLRWNKHTPFLIDDGAAAAAAAAKSLQSCPTLCDPRDGSPPGSPIPLILQARTLEWVAISCSNAWKWKMKVKLLSPVRPLETPWTAAYKAPLSVGFSRQEYWSGVPLPSLDWWWRLTLICIGQAGKWEGDKRYKQREPRRVSSLLWDRPTLMPWGCTVLCLFNKTLSCNLAVTLDYHFKSLLKWDCTEEITHASETFNESTDSIESIESVDDNFASWCLMQFLFSITSIIFVQLLIDSAKGLPFTSSAGKEFACNAGDPNSIPGLGRFPGVEHGSPFQ